MTDFPTTKIVIFLSPTKFLSKIMSFYDSIFD